MIRKVGDVPPLPANRAFVVQFSRDDEDGSCFGGRIEHIESGRVEVFYSREEMDKKFRAFLEQIRSDSKA